MVGQLTAFVENAFKHGKKEGSTTGVTIRIEVSRQRFEFRIINVINPVREQLSGLKLVNILNPKPKIILTTAYDSYAIKAFDLEVDDYLLKPI